MDDYKRSENQINLFGMCVYIRMLKVGWKEIKTNVEIMRLVGSIKTIANIIKEKKIRYGDGYFMRHDSLQKELLEGEVDREKGKGRQRKKCHFKMCHFRHLSSSKGSGIQNDVLDYFYFVSGYPRLAILN